MQFLPLNQIANLQFAQTLYENSFPHNERRDFTEIIKLSECSNFDFFVIKDDNDVGIISFWYFADFFFAEHFAIAPFCRNLGIGTRVMNELLRYVSLPVILETEPARDEITKKRIVFYERLGFRMIDCPYFQPPYRQNEEKVQMSLMTSSFDVFYFLSKEEIIHQIHHEVYKITN